MSPTKEMPRSEIARQRRAQRAARELTQTTKRAIKPAVTVSSRVAPPDATSRKRGARPRRFNIALGMPEIHLQKPGFRVPRLYASWRLGSAFIVILIGVFYLTKFLSK